MGHFYKKEGTLWLKFLPSDRQSTRNGKRSFTKKGYPIFNNPLSMVVPENVVPVEVDHIGDVILKDTGTMFKVKQDPAPSSLTKSLLLNHPSTHWSAEWVNRAELSTLFANLITQH